VPTKCCDFLFNFEIIAFRCVSTFALSMMMINEIVQQTPISIAFVEKMNLCVGLIQVIVLLFDKRADHFKACYCRLERNMRNRLRFSVVGTSDYKIPSKTVTERALLASKDEHY
jgi:hypothetical protein